MKSLFSRVAFGALLVAALPLTAFAASPAKKTAAELAAGAVDLFAGIESGDIEAKVIVKDSTEATVTVKNKTGKPLTIKMPEALAAAPVAAQFDAGAGLNDANGGAGNNVNQGVGMGGGGMMGGGMGGMGGGMMGGGMGGGFFNVAPEKVAKIKLNAVCLDHGMKDPNPRVEYKLLPIEKYAKNPAVIEVVKLMARRQLDQHSAQAAAWHLQNGLTWEELATKIGAKHLNGQVEPYFTSVHLHRALAAANFAQERAEKAKQDSNEKSIGDELAAQ